MAGLIHFPNHLSKAHFFKMLVSYVNQNKDLDLQTIDGEV
jgi:hypothetical protein